MRAVRPPLLSLALVSAGALAYELLLIRLFAIIQWHHFAYMVISLALLGYGVSGTWLALTRGWHAGRFDRAFPAYALAFGVTTLGAFQLAQHLPFNALEVFWDGRQLGWLMALYLALFVPFFCAASCICLAISTHQERVNRVYSADLVGAGAGAALLVGLLFVLPPDRALGAIAALGIVAAGTAWLELGRRPRAAAALALPAALLLLVADVDLRVSPYKGLSQALSVAGAQPVDTRSSPLGQLTTVENTEVPVRYAPGLSLHAPDGPPDQLSVFTDSDALSVIDRAADGSPPVYLDWLSSALPYHVVDERPRVLVLGAGTGTPVLQARGHAPASVDAVELNPQVTALVTERFREYSGNPFGHATVRLHHEEARGFVSREPGPWDVIQLPPMDSFGATTAGLHALSENYLYTIEAFGSLLGRLSPGGLLAVTRWVRLPPRDSLKILAIAIAALERAAVPEPGTHLAMVRGWRTSTLLVARQPLSPTAISRIRAFARSRGFDVVYYPGMERTEANRFNLLDEPWFHDYAARLLGAGADADAFIHDYKFNVRPPADDRPYFAHFLKLRTLPELLSLRGRGGLPLIEQGYPVLAATLVQALLASAVLILLPLLLHRRSQLRGRNSGRTLAFFFAIGMGFMFVEIAFIQKFIQFLGHPLYAIAVVLTSFLVFAGAGSWLTGRGPPPRSVRGPVAGIVVLSVAYLALLPSVFRAGIGWPDGVRILVSVALIAPLALLMGTPFPIAMHHLASRRVAWAWGVNGCASVISAVLATLVAVHLGFNAVVLLAAGLYVAAALALPSAQALRGQ